MASMVVAIRQVCALTIQNWWKKCYKRLKTSRASGFECSVIPTSWKRQSNASSVPSVLLAHGNNKFDLYKKNSTKIKRTASSNSADSRRTTTTHSSSGDRFDRGYYNRSHVDLYDEDIDDRLKLDDENFEASISLLTKMQNGIVGRFVKFFKRRMKGDQPKKKKNRLRNVFKRVKKKDEISQTPPTPMIGDPEVNAELPDPLSLYQPLEEDESIKIEYTAQWVPQDVDSFSIMAGSFASFSDMDEIHNLAPDDLQSVSDDESCRYDDEDLSIRPLLLVPSRTYNSHDESVPFDEI